MKQRFIEGKNYFEYLRGDCELNLNIFPRRHLTVSKLRKQMKTKPSKKVLSTSALLQQK